jgi:outer membrane protein assembly factor BamB
LSSDGGHVYLRDAVFDLRGTRQPSGKPHLFTLTHFLDDVWAHRSYWIFGTRCSISTGCSGRNRNLVYGRLLVFDDSTIYGYGRSDVHWSNQLQDGPYRLYALNRGESAARWRKDLPIRVRAMIGAGKVLFVAGPPADRGASGDEDANQDATLMALATSDGTELARYDLDGPPIFDGMAAARGRLYVCLKSGRMICMDEQEDAR